MSHQQKEFSTLYSEGAHGRKLTWRIFVNDADIHIIHGEMDGKLNEHIKTIIETKSKRTPHEQAVFEAERKWKDQKEKKNYVEDSNDTGKIASLQQIRPMLAQNYTIPKRFPVYVQRKYDGVRCLAYVENGEIMLNSRRGKLFFNLNHIRDSLRWLSKNVILDGELYKDSGDFQSITGTARRKTEEDNASEDMYYVIYDAIFLDDVTMTYANRRAKLLKLVENIILTTSAIKLAPTFTANSVAEIKQLHDTFVSDGFEGAIIRDPNGTYEIDKRSKFLMKMKEFDEDEFKIIGFGESSGNDAGTVVWTVEVSGAKDGSPLITANVKHTGSAELRRHLFENGTDYIGKMLTVKFFGKTNDGSLRFPVGKSIRDYE